MTEVPTPVRLGIAVILSAPEDDADGGEAASAAGCDFDEPLHAAAARPNTATNANAAKRWREPDTGPWSGFEYCSIHRTPQRGNQGARATCFPPGSAIADHAVAISPIAALA